MRASFEYALIRVVPDVARGELINVGAIVFCEHHAYLDARIALDIPRLLALSPDADVETIATYLAAIPRICRGDKEVGAVAELTLRERFRWLVATRSTVIQTSPAHAGLDESPDAALDRLIRTMVLLPRRRV